MNKVLRLCFVLSFFLVICHPRLWSQAKLDQVAMFLRVEGVERWWEQISWEDRGGKKLPAQPAWEFYDDDYWFCWQSPGEYLLNIGGQQERLLLLPYTNVIMSLDLQSNGVLNTYFPLNKLSYLWSFRFGQLEDKIMIHADTGQENWLLVTNDTELQPGMFRVLASSYRESGAGSVPVNAWDLSRITARAELNLRDNDQGVSTIGLPTAASDLILVEVTAADSIKVIADQEIQNRGTNNYNKITGLMLQGRIGRMQCLATEAGPVVIYTIKEN